jgi:uncharacterized integral membrane protein
MAGSALLVCILTFITVSSAIAALKLFKARKIVPTFVFALLAIVAGFFLNWLTKGL